MTHFTRFNAQPRPPRKELAKQLMSAELARVREDAKLLWLVLDDLMAGRESALVDAQVISKLLERTRPNVDTSRPSVVAFIVMLFESVSPHVRQDLVEALVHKYGVNLK